MCRNHALPFSLFCAAALSDLVGGLRVGKHSKLRVFWQLELAKLQAFLKTGCMLHTPAKRWHLLLVLLCFLLCLWEWASREGPCGKMARCRKIGRRCGQRCSETLVSKGWQIAMGKPYELIKHLIDSVAAAGKPHKAEGPLAPRLPLVIDRTTVDALPHRFILLEDQILSNPSP